MKIGDRVIFMPNPTRLDFLSGTIVLVNKDAIADYQYKIESSSNSKNRSHYYWVTSSEVELDKAYYRNEKLIEIGI